MNMISFWRRERLLTQEMLSLATGIPRHRLGLLERQVEDPTTVERDVIAKVLQIPNEKLIRGDEPQFNSEISFGDGEL